MSNNFQLLSNLWCMLNDDALLNWTIMSVSNVFILQDRESKKDHVTLNIWRCKHATEMWNALMELKLCQNLNDEYRILIHIFLAKSCNFDIENDNYGIIIWVFYFVRNNYMKIFLIWGRKIIHHNNCIKSGEMENYFITKSGRNLLNTKWTIFISILIGQ